MNRGIPRSLSSRSLDKPGHNGTDDTVAGKAVAEVRRRNRPDVPPGQPGTVLDADALARGYVVATSSMLVNGQHANFVTAAETSLMLKEHVIERYGELQYTVGEGASGGALLQYLIADAYPGILDGLRPTQDWQDSLSGAYGEFADSGVIMQAITFSSLSYSDAEQCGHRRLGRHERRRLQYGEPSASLITSRPGATARRCSGAASYDPMTNPRGVRCTFQDFMASVIGRRPDGAAHLVYDNVGVQYRLKAVEAGLISVDQFVDLNVRAGGYDRDGRWQAARNRIDENVAARLYRSGHVTAGGADSAASRSSRDSRHQQQRLSLSVSHSRQSCASPRRERSCEQSRLLDRSSARGEHARAHGSLVIRRGL